MQGNATAHAFDDAHRLSGARGIDYHIHRQKQRCRKSKPAPPNARAVHNMPRSKTNSQLVPTLATKFEPDPANAGCISASSELRINTSVHVPLSARSFCAVNLLARILCCVLSTVRLPEQASKQRFMTQTRLRK
jgi:hypothetical protein